MIDDQRHQRSRTATAVTVCSYTQRSIGMEEIEENWSRDPRPDWTHLRNAILFYVMPLSPYIGRSTNSCITHSA